MAASSVAERPPLVPLHIRKLESYTRPLFRRSLMPVVARKAKSRVQSSLVLFGLLVAIGILLRTVDAQYPLQHWLFLRYAKYSLLSAGFGACTLTLGHALLRGALGRVLPVREQLALSFPLGLLGYFILAFCAGVLGLLGPVFFVAAPLLMLALGARPTLRYARRLLRHVRYVRRVHPGEHHTWLRSCIPVLGFAALGLIYFSILSPYNASYDARWYHLPLAEQYAYSGRIFRFAEGWVLGTYPQLASILYAWAFMLPGALLFDRIELCAHLEFQVFVWTLVAVPSLARRLLPRSFRRTLQTQPRLAQAWVAVFLFPGLFLYDSSLNLGADHVAALWAIPIYLMLLRVWPTLAVRECCVLAALMAGALLTKYTAILIVAPALCAIAIRAIVLTVASVRGRARSPWPGLCAAAVSGVVLTAPHWLKNWLWYGDPLYPQLQGKLALHPWLREATIPYYEDIAVAWHAPHTRAGLLEALKIAFTYAFVHHDWPDLHGTAPIFGFLFTLSLGILPFLGKAPRLWGVFLAGHLSVVLWALISWQDRYLQGLVPWMAAAIAATFAMVWQLHSVTRLALVALIALQAVWGSDVYFYNTHRMLGSTPAKASIELLNTARLGNYTQRFDIFEPLASIGAAMPSDAKVLLHGSRQTLGLGRVHVNDSPGTQGGIAYSRYVSPRAVYDALHDLGVTHLLWDEQSEGFDTLASDLVFFDFAKYFTRRPSRQGWLWLARMPSKPPPSRPFGQEVAYLACRGTYSPSGIYHLSDLTVPFFGRHKVPKPVEPLSTSLDEKQAANRAQFLVFDPGCNLNLDADTLSHFELIARRGTALLYARQHKR